ncbi:MAG: hypothetical protein DRR06_06825 [Gammaproteobacteria bacterium]|nr:MAG: hypothetical protein DRR06_06825 [Gammaproteobacteria bacterium]RLA52912.1 MAG: hypothetical protein DRR42_06215 [Gammaproteobacteria bacterium]
MKYAFILTILLITIPNAWSGCVDSNSDDKQVLATCLKEADGGDPEAQLALADIYLDGKIVPQNYQQALEWYRQAAQQGNAHAMYNIGVFYDRGYSVDVDYEEASNWYRKAAALGFPAALYNIGIMYEYGQTVPKDYAKAHEYYLMAAEKGEPSAQFSLGLLYDKGLGVGKDYVTAYMWWEITGDGHIYAKQNNESIATEMTPMQISEAKRLAGLWLKKHNVKQLPAQEFPPGFK